MARKGSSDETIKKDRDRALQWYYDHREEVLKKRKAAYAENKANRSRIAELEAEIERLRGELDDEKE